MNIKLMEILCENEKCFKFWLIKFSISQCMCVVLLRFFFYGKITFTLKLKSKTFRVKYVHDFLFIFRRKKKLWFVLSFALFLFCLMLLCVDFVCAMSWNSRKIVVVAVIGSKIFNNLFIVFSSNWILFNIWHFFCSYFIFICCKIRQDKTQNTRHGNLSYFIFIKSVFECFDAKSSMVLFYIFFCFVLYSF